MPVQNIRFVGSSDSLFAFQSTYQLALHSLLFTLWLCVCHCQERGQPVLCTIPMVLFFFFEETGAAEVPTEILLRDKQKQSTKKQNRGGHSRNKERNKENEVSYKLRSSHVSIFGRYFFFACRITRRKTFLKMNLH